MTTESLAPVAASNATATAATAETTETLVDESQTTDEVESEVAEPGEGTPEGEAEADKVQAEVDKATRKARRRIDRLIADRATVSAENARLAAELAEAKAAKEGEGAKPAAEDPRKIAQELRIVEKTVEATEAVWKEAGKKYPDFEAKIKELVEEAGPLIDPKGRPVPLMAAVLELDVAVATDVLAHLGDNPDVAAELMGLSATKLGRRMLQLEIELSAKAKPKPSAAAKPLTPVKPSAAIVVDETKLSDKQWHAAKLKARMGA